MNLRVDLLRHVTSIALWHRQPWFLSVLFAAQSGSMQNHEATISGPFFRLPHEHTHTHTPEGDTCTNRTPPLHTYMYIQRTSHLFFSHPARLAPHRKPHNTSMKRPRATLSPHGGWDSQQGASCHSLKGTQWGQRGPALPMRSLVGYECREMFLIATSAILCW